MFFRIMDSDHIPDLINGLAREHEVIAPVKQGDSYRFDTVTNSEGVVLDYPTTIIPPKKYFLKDDECLLRFNTVTGDVTDSERQTADRVIFGVHACDINAILMTDKVFLGDFEDPYYKAQRERTLIIGTSCMPSPECMCNTFGTGEVHHSYDLFLTDLGDRYWVACRSVEGSHLLDALVETREVSPEDIAAFQARQEKFNNSFEPASDMTQIPVLFDAKYNDTLWSEIGDACLGCAACSAVCPTCYCFDISDEMDSDGKCGSRVRCWDSCLGSEFALVAGNHDFRPTKASRVRYRYYHKFLSYPSKYGQMLCVGCGRCQIACKAHITPRRVIFELQKEVRS